MATKGKVPRSKNHADQVGSQKLGRQTPDVRSTAVRSIVEQQFLLMEQAHDRIRATELAAHLRPDQLAS